MEILPLEIIELKNKIGVFHFFTEMFVGFKLLRRPFFQKAAECD